jgi:hypothetical protein
MMTRALPEGSFLPSRRSPLVAVGRRYREREPSLFDLRATVVLPLSIGGWA